MIRMRRILVGTVEIPIKTVEIFVGRTILSIISGGMNEGRGFSFESFPGGGGDCGGGGSRSGGAEGQGT